jgi:hypothetical protein
VWDWRTMDDGCGRSPNGLKICLRRSIENMSILGIEGHLRRSSTPGPAPALAAAILALPSGVLGPVCPLEKPELQPIWHRHGVGGAAGIQSKPESLRRKRREQAVTKAERALEAAKQEHETKIKIIVTDRAALDRRSQAEDARWEKQKEKLETDLRRARD